MNRSKRLAGLSVAAIAAGLLLALIVPGIASASARPLTFEIYIGDTCVSGTAGDNAMVALTWKAAIGSIKATTHVQANSYDGRWVYCTTGSPVVQIGDVIKATVGTATRRFVVPELGVVQNRTKESYHGRGPAGDYLGISCPYNFYVVEPCQPFYPWRVRVSSYGRWSLPNREGHWR